MIATDDDYLHEEFRFVLQELIGAPLSSFDSHLVLRGLKTLPARLSVHEDNATRVAEFLLDHDAVETVNYPGLSSHPRHDLATEQMENVGGMISFEIDGDAAEARAFVEDLDVFNLAFSLGGVESLVEHTASMSAATLSAEERAEAGISNSLVRLSVGLESADDLIADLRESLRPV